jgi:hypothetical protein
MTQQLALKALITVSAASPRLIQAYRAVLVLAHTQIDQHVNEIAVAPFLSRATATICGPYEARRKTFDAPKATHTRSKLPNTDIVSRLQECDQFLASCGKQK